MKIRKTISAILFLLLFLTQVVFLYPVVQSFAEGGKTKVIIHYAKDPSSNLNWNLWVWPNGKDGKRYDFTGKDAFGDVCVIEFDEQYNKVGLIVRTDDWKKDGDADRFIENFKDGVGEIWLKAGDPAVYTTLPDGKASSKPVVLGDETKVTVHYFRFDKNYEGWNLWAWPDKKDGASYNFTSEDSFGKVASFTLKGTKDVSKIGFIVRQSTSGNEWASKEFSDRFITKFKEDGSVEVWLAQDDGGVYYNPESIDLSPKFTSALLEDFKTIRIESNLPFPITFAGSDGFVVKVNGKEAEIEFVSTDEIKDGFTRSGRVTLKNNVNINDKISIQREGYKETMITLGNIFSSEAFDEQYYYDGKDLGNTYTKQKTSFRLWAPTAEEAKLVIYDKWDAKEGKEISMTKAEKGTWTASLSGDQNGTFYTYKVKFGDIWNEASDPYAHSAAANGDKSAVIDLTKTNPDKWNANSRLKVKSAVDAIIYELHVRDLSMHPDSGIKNKGKFLGLTETGTTGPKGTKTGLDHIKDLGVTHVQLLPIYDFGSVDETKNDQFNWGYDPENYNSPEGSYATDPYNPEIRVKELKQAVQTLHDNKLGVIMDVVYNHMYSEANSNFNKLVPGYYFRHSKDGSSANESGCGNTTASERKMVRKFIVDSVVYWAKEYNLDGFRFDLMGLLDVETMNVVRTELNKINPNIIVIGEGWDMGNTLTAEQKANQKNASNMPNIAHFNDTIRDGLKGSVFEAAEAGFVNGDDKNELDVKKGIVGAINYSAQINTWGDKVEPNQSVTYAEAHDNNTLWDKLLLTNPKDSDETRKQMHRMADAIILTSQGIPFIHAGQEFLRTKNGNENSFNSGDEVNRLDWARKADNMDTVNYFKGLIELRKSHPAFRMTSSLMIKEHMTFLETPKNVIAYSIDKNANDDKWDNIVVAFNANKEPQTIKLPKSGKWNLVVNGEKAGKETLQTIEGDSITIPALSSYVLYSGVRSPFTTPMFWLWTAIGLATVSLSMLASRSRLI